MSYFAELHDLFQKKKKKQLKTPIELLVREEHELQYPKLKCYKIFFQTMSKSL